MHKKNRKSHSSVPVYLFLTILYSASARLCKLKTTLSGDIETNPDPAQKNPNKSISMCHWNLNSATAHGYANVTVKKAYI